MILSRVFIQSLFAGLIFVILQGCSATGKIIKSGDEALARGDSYLAANEYLRVLNMKPKDNKALRKLSVVAKPAYDQKLAMARGYQEQSNFESALREYEELRDYLHKLYQLKLLNFLPIDVGKSIETVSSGAAENHYAKAERLFNNGEYDPAALEYQEALNYDSNYKDSKEKVSKSYYQIGLDLESKAQYRASANNYLKADKFIMGFQDAAQRSAKIYYGLGSYFLSLNQCRNAYEDFKAVQDIISGFEDVAEKLSQSDDCATVRVAFVRFDNPTGRNLAGMALGDFIFEAIKTKTQARASRFIRMLERQELLLLAREQQISEGLLTDESTIPKTLEGVQYVIFGKLNQVRDARKGLSRTAVTDTYDYFYEVQKRNKKGKLYTDTEWAQANLYYNVYDDKLTVSISGVIKVVEARSGAVVINHQVSKDAVDTIRFTSDFRTALGHSINADNVRIRDEIVSLSNERRVLKDVGDLAKEIIDAVAREMSERILSELDVTPHVPDPAMLDM